MSTKPGREIVGLKVHPLPPTLSYKLDQVDSLLVEVLSTNTRERRHKMCTYCNDRNFPCPGSTMWRPCRFCEDAGIDCVRSDRKERILPPERSYLALGSTFVPASAHQQVVAPPADPEYGAVNGMAPTMVHLTAPNGAPASVYLTASAASTPGTAPSVSTSASVVTPFTSVTGTSAPSTVVDQSQFQVAPGIPSLITTSGALSADKPDGVKTSSLALPRRDGTFDRGFDLVAVDRSDDSSVVSPHPRSAAKAQSIASLAAMFDGPPTFPSADDIVRSVFEGSLYDFERINAEHSSRASDSTVTDVGSGSGASQGVIYGATSASSMDPTGLEMGFGGTAIRSSGFDPGSSSMSSGLSATSADQCGRGDVQPLEHALEFDPFMGFYNIPGFTLGNLNMNPALGGFGLYGSGDYTFGDSSGTSFSNYSSLDGAMGTDAYIYGTGLPIAA